MENVSSNVVNSDQADEKVLQMFSNVMVIFQLVTKLLLIFTWLVFLRLDK